jgi:gamma-glutamylcyclotransferase (GGCT)/AIG2-like uncharacterized protein YtfP
MSKQSHTNIPFPFKNPFPYPRLFHNNLITSNLPKKSLFLISRPNSPNQPQIPINIPNTTMASEPDSHSAFFYGTLMAPQVLHRVCHGSTSPSNPLYTTHNLKTYPAILHNHRRHRVKSADYPAIVKHEGSSVRGTYVTGLTQNDIFRLDIFEGDQYVRVPVKAKLLTTVGDENGVGNVEGEEVEAETYVWCDLREALEEREWDFAEFQREKMKYWTGEEGEIEYAGKPPVFDAGLVI